MPQKKSSLRSKILDGIIASLAIGFTFWLLYTHAIPKQLLFNQEMSHRSRLASVGAGDE
jgi:hypothetical protein